MLLYVGDTHVTRGQMKMRLDRWWEELLFYDYLIGR